jgi:hypothetical protein
VQSKATKREPLNTPSEKAITFRTGIQSREETQSNFKPVRNRFSSHISADNVEKALVREVGGPENE